MQQRIVLDLRGKVPDLELEPSMHNRVVLVRPVVWRPTEGRLPCWPGSALALPGPWTNGRHPIPLVLHAVHHARVWPGSCVLVVGWLAADGAEASRGAALAQARADALAAVVANRRAAWVTVATKWGSLAEVLGYLDYLHRDRGFACAVEQISPSPSDASATSVAAFQAEYNHRFDGAIDEDGICGEQTLGAVFDVVRFEWDRWLVKYGLEQSDVDAIGLEFLADDGAEPTDGAGIADETEGGIDVVVAQRAAFGGERPSARVLYQSPVARLRRFEVAAEPGGWQTGPYTLVTDLTAHEPVHPEIYRLSAADGSYVAERRLPEDAIDRDLLELHFEHLPCDRSYRLEVEIPQVGRYELFADVPYGQLHAQATAPIDDEPGTHDPNADERS